MTSSRGIKATETIIKHLEKIDKPPGQEDGGAKVKEENEETFGEASLFDVTKDDDEVKDKSQILMTLKRIFKLLGY